MKNALATSKPVMNKITTKFADQAKNKRLRVPPLEDFGAVRRRRPCPYVQKCQDGEQDAARNEGSSPERVGPLPIIRHGWSCPSLEPIVPPREMER